MSETPLARIVEYCDRILAPDQFEDWPGAVNGLQVENSGIVRHLAAAVDASTTTIRRATEIDADLLLVHHGLFWSPSHPWTGKRFQMMTNLVRNNLAVYSSHLPLDGHPRFGNNIRLCGLLRFKTPKPFFFDRGGYLGFQATTRIGRTELIQRLSKVLGSEPRVIPGGPTLCRRIGVVTGGAGADLAKAAAEGVDTFITGEGPHWTFAAAEDLGINVLYGGHYATETFGVKALAEHLSKKYGLPWTFIDHPTGL